MGWWNRFFSQRTSSNTTSGKLGSDGSPAESEQHEEKGAPLGADCATPSVESGQGAVQEPPGREGLKDRGRAADPADVAAPGRRERRAAPVNHTGEEGTGGSLEHQEGDADAFRGTGGSLGHQEGDADAHSRTGRAPVFAEHRTEKHKEPFSGVEEWVFEAGFRRADRPLSEVREKARPPGGHDGAAPSGDGRPRIADWSAREGEEARTGLRAPSESNHPISGPVRRTSVGPQCCVAPGNGPAAEAPVAWTARELPTRDDIPPAVAAAEVSVVQTAREHPTRDDLLPALAAEEGSAPGSDQPPARSLTTHEVLPPPEAPTAGTAPLLSRRSDPMSALPEAEGPAGWSERGPQGHTVAVEFSGVRIETRVAGAGALVPPDPSRRGDQAERSAPLAEQDTEQTAMITASDVIEHVYCRRYTWFLHVQNIPQFEEQRYKVLKGREIHRRREKHNREYLRKKIGAVGRDISVYLASRKLRVRGVVDEVLELEDGTYAPLDYKYTRAPEQMFRTHRIQVTLYGMLIEEAYGVQVDRGFVAYVRGGNQLLQAPIDDRGRMEAMRLVAEVFDIMSTGRLPSRTRFRARCADCCYRNICV